MRRGLIVVATALLAVVVPGSATALFSLGEYESAVDALEAFDPTIEPAANDPGKDLVVGGFQGVENNNVGLSGHGGPLGEEPQGHVSETIPLFFPTTSSSTYQGRFRVTCVAVIGNEAALGLVPTDTASNDQPAEFILAVRDNRLVGLPDEYALYKGAEVLAQDCLAFVGDAIFTIERGNILVHDAVPAP